ncbi:hypothetical protein GCM10011514_04560 [Emticicia aquatilis]|uniref:ELWxxDGT repeat protein n=1 Tax=Emticicia aquatilis TaxID=1537369 RepID=A0A917DK06_9BACT|nr:hypothetical protein [Emticicia aquatilis]GGD43726.1 hypothetical protein GCM10011514_04560 [Emticicia aquatilis]
MKRTIICTFLFLAFHFSFAQISLFKDINTLEAGSNPANFVEANGLVFFTVQRIDGYYLWKTDGTEAGTRQVSEQKIVINLFNNTFSNSVTNLYVHNNEVYYQTKNASTGVIELWKTNGTTPVLILNNFTGTHFFSYNNNLYFFDFATSIYKIENNNASLVKSIPNVTLLEKTVLMNNIVYFFVKGNTAIEVWKTDGTETGTVQITTIDNTIDIYYNYNTNDPKIVGTENQIFLFVYRMRKDEINNLLLYDTELWRTDGTTTGTALIKTILTQNDYSITFSAKSPTKFGNKIVFNESGKLWISDGTEANTQIIKSFQSIYNNPYTRSYGVLNDKFFFSAQENNDFELWISDGTYTGTQLLKDINPNESSLPNHFDKIGNKVFFRANNNNELWKTDGTVTGTVFVQNIAKPDGLSPFDITSLEYIYTSTNQLFYKNYDAQNNYELWIYDGVSSKLVKNIVTTSSNSNVSDKRVKIGNTWYFSAIDHQGAELWKSDGTINATTIVKDISEGAYSTNIREMVAIGNIVYFTANSTTDSKMRLWRSDGTNTGTFEIPLSSGLQGDIGVNPEKLTVVGNKLFFKGLSTQGYLWVSDGTITNTRPINNRIILGNLNNLTHVNGKLFFTNERLWISDGTDAGTKLVSENFFDTPISPVCLIEFQSKLYFFSTYTTPAFESGTALWESDGTVNGTKIIKEFNESDDYLTSSFRLFLEKSTNKLFFRVKPTVSTFDLWTSDGTGIGTNKLTTVNTLSSQIKQSFSSLGNKFFMFLYSSADRPAWGWSSDGTVDGTQIFIQRILRNTGISDAKAFNGKLYFGIDDDRYGHELWSTDGTPLGTQLAGEVQSGPASSYVNSLMDFSDKLVFWGYDNTYGMEPRYFNGQICKEECIPFRVIKTKTLNRQ